jgi:hypothetical protein
VETVGGGGGGGGGGSAVLVRLIVLYMPSYILFELH